MSFSGIRTCPTCLASFDATTVTYINSEGEKVGAPATNRLPSVGKLLKSFVLGDPDLAREYNAAAYASVVASGITPACPFGHALPEAVFERPTFVIALVGEKSSGKTLYLASLINELVSKGPLAHRGLRFSIEGNSLQEFEREYMPLIKEKKPLRATMRHVVESASRSPFFLSMDVTGSKGANILVYDADGAQLVSPQIQSKFNRHMWATDAVIFFMPPAVFPGLPDIVRSHADEDQTALISVSVLSATIKLLSKAQSRPHATVAALVLSKADVLDALNLPEISGLSRDLPYGDLDLHAVHELIQNDSLFARSFIGRVGGHQYCQLAEGCFRSVSYHLVSSTGSGLSHSGVFDNLKPRRIIDPLVSVLVALGGIDLDADRTAGRF